MIGVKIQQNVHYWDTITRKLNITVEQGIQDVARLAATKAAASTFPTGTSNKTKDVLEKAIYKDINRAYLVVDERNQHINDEDGNYLLRHRERKGRVPDTVERIAIRREDYNKLKDRFVKRAGMAKAGWLQAAADVKSGVRVPAWLRKHGQLLGSADIRKDSVTVTNHCKYASELITQQQLRNIMINAFQGLYKRAQRMKL